MPRAKVYQYRQVDPTSGRTIISFYKMTAAAIDAMGGQVIADTEQDVQETALDGDGGYTP